MLNLLDYVDRKFTIVDPSLFPLAFPMVLQWGKRGRFTGLVLHEEVLTLDYRRMTAFRTTMDNLGTMARGARAYGPKDPCPYSLQYLDAYFRDSRDNPYAIWNVLQTFITGPFPQTFTPFPPLFPRKSAADQAASIQELHQRCAPADAVFSFDRRSGIHSLIRRIDRGMWGHVGIVSPSRTVIDIGPQGVIESPFSSLADERLDVGLYRLRGISIEGASDAATWMQQQVGVRGYNWRGVFRMFLLKQFRWLPLRRTKDDVSPADLVYGNQFDLVGSA